MRGLMKDARSRFFTHRKISLRTKAKERLLPPLLSCESLTIMYSICLRTSRMRGFKGLLLRSLKTMKITNLKMKWPRMLKFLTKKTVSFTIYLKSFE